jgi:hypothetical protein
LVQLRRSRSDWVDGIKALVIVELLSGKCRFLRERR